MNLLKIYKNIPKRPVGTLLLNNIGVDLTTYNNFGIWLVYEDTLEIFAKYAYVLSGLTGFEKLEYLTTGTDGKYTFIIQPSQTVNARVGKLLIVFKAAITDTEPDPDLVSETGDMNPITSPTLWAEILETPATETI
jgi:hypothetical protein